DAREMLATSERLSFRDVDDKEYLDGTDIKEGSAKQDFDENNNANVTLKLQDADKFGEVTTDIANKGIGNNMLVIWMAYQGGEAFKEEPEKSDPRLIAAPQAAVPLNTSDVQITGVFTSEEAQRVADIINSGSLPVHMEQLYSTAVGAQFGEQALNKTVF